MSLLEKAPLCPFCEGLGAIYCGDLPPLECPKCLGTKKDVEWWHRQRHAPKGEGEG